MSLGLLPILPVRGSTHVRHRVGRKEHLRVGGDLVQDVLLPRSQINHHAWHTARRTIWEDASGHAMISIPVVRGAATVEVLDIRVVGMGEQEGGVRSGASTLQPATGVLLGIALPVPGGVRVIVIGKRARVRAWMLLV